jgi:hypothetical protein
MTELVRSYLRAAGRHGPIVPMPLSGNAARAIRNGAILAPDRAKSKRRSTGAPS